MEQMMFSSVAFLSASNRPLPIPSIPNKTRHRNTPCCSQKGKQTNPSKTSKRRQRVSKTEISNFKQITDVSIGDEFLAKVYDVGPADSNWLDIGVVTSTGLPVHGRLKFRETPCATNREEKEGAVLPVYVWKIQHASGRIECRRGSSKPNQEHSLPDNARMLSDLKLAEQIRATVIGLGPYGAVMDANVYRFGKRNRKVACNGLLHRKRFKSRWASATDRMIRDDVERVLEIGDVLTVWVRGAHESSGLLFLDASEVSAEQLEKERAEYQAKVKKRARRSGAEILKVGERRKGFVREVVKFGLFIDIGLKNDGLIHFTQMGKEHRWDWKDTIVKGTEVITEVIVVEGKRVGLKLVAVGGIDEDEEDAMAAALSPMARLGDIAVANDLHGMPQSKRKLLEEEALMETEMELDGSGADESEEADVQASNETEELDEEEDEEEDEDYKFSDDYFEDKYGY